MSSKILNTKKNTFLSFISGIITAISITLILILLFAVLIRFFDINDNWIFPVNQIIKFISLFFGVYIVIKKNRQKGQGLIWVKYIRSYFFIPF